MDGSLPTFNQLTESMTESGGMFCDLLRKSLSTSYCDVATDDASENPPSDKDAPNEEDVPDENEANKADGSEHIDGQDDHELESDFDATTTLQLLDLPPSLTEDIWEAIKLNRYVKMAFYKFKRMKIKQKSETAYSSVVDIGNAMSFAYITKMLPNAPSNMPVVFFDSPRDYLGHGNFLGEASNPDWVCYLVPLSVLKKAVKAAYKATSSTSVRQVQALPQGRPQFIGTGKLKPNPVDLDGESDLALTNRGYFTRFLAGHKRYRPDLSTVHGFLFAENKVTLASLNPCGIIFHPTANRTDISVWISFVVLIYDSVARRDTNISTVKPDGPHVRYEVLSPARGKIPCVPFYSSSGPGRMTWAAFEVVSDEEGAVCKEDCQGFVKISWQDKISAGRERALFNIAHNKEWLPGLARNWDSPDEENIDDRESIITDGIVRVKEITHLASVGDPLSHCTSALHAFMLFFDLVGVHREMVDRGILHRDISWYNVLCNPWHHPDTLKIKQPATADKAVRCIEYVITGDLNAEPCVLLTDLDHAADLTVFYGPDYIHRNQRTGTPMFIAIELGAGDKPIPYASHTNPAVLVKALRAAEKFETIFTRAFPPGDTPDTRFLANFEKVLELEQIRLSEYRNATTDPHEVHRPAHDVESMFWIFFWLFIRALPVGCLESEGGLYSQDFVQYVNLVLRQSIGEVRTRADRLFNRAFSAFTHDQLHIWLPALENIAIYLSIPWRLYRAIVEPEHAHIAIRRLLLSAILEHGNKDVRLNCWKPRDARDVSGMFPSSRKVETQTSESTSTYNSQASRVASKSSARKRKVLDGAEYAPSSKRPKLSSSQNLSRITSSKDTSLTNRRGSPKVRSKPAWLQCKDGCNSKSACVRCEKMWNDRSCWFGVGSGELHDEETGPDSDADEDEKKDGKQLAPPNEAVERVLEELKILLGDAESSSSGVIPAVPIEVRPDWSEKWKR